MAVQNKRKQEKKFKLSRVPWEVIALIVSLVVLGVIFYNLTKSLDLSDGLYPNQ